MEKIKLILLLLILAVAAYLRLWRVSEYMTFLGDEGRDALVVKRIIIDHRFTLLGPTASVGGFFLGPIYYYFMAPFLWLWRLDPTGPAVMVALFGVATVYLVYRVGKDFFQEGVGLVAASLYAVSPLVIAYSRSSWNPNVVPFFSTLLIYLLWKAAMLKKESILFWIGIVLGVGLQLHYLFTFLFVVSGLWVLFFVKPARLVRAIGWVVAGFVIGYGPFLLFELRHGFPNTQTVIRFILEGKDTGFTLAQFLKNINDVSFRLLGRLVLRFPQVEWWNRFTNWQQFAWVGIIKLALFLGLGTSIFFASRRSVGTKQQTAGQLMVLWFATTVLLFGLYKRGIFDYYFGIIFALPFILVSTVLWVFWQNGKTGKLFSTIFLLGLLWFNWRGRPYRFPPNNQLGQAKLIASEVLEKSGGNPFNFALITGQNSDHAYRYFFEIWGNSPLTIENEAVDPKRQTITDQLIVVCELPSSECKPLGHPLWEIAGFGRAEIVGEWDVSFVKIFKLVHFVI